MPRRSAGAGPKSVLKFPRKTIGLRTPGHVSSPPLDDEVATADVEGVRERLRAENAELRARAVELMLQIRALRES
jgi:hypothetical protein